MSDDIPHDEITLLEATTDQLIAELCRRSEAGICSYIATDVRDANRYSDHYRCWGLDVAALGLAIETQRIVQQKIDGHRQEEEERQRDNDDSDGDDDEEKRR